MFYQQRKRHLYRLASETKKSDVRFLNQGGPQLFLALRGRDQMGNKFPRVRIAAESRNSAGTLLLKVRLSKNAVSIYPLSFYPPKTRQSAIFTVASLSGQKGLHGVSAVHLPTSWTRNRGQYLLQRSQ